MSLQRGSALMMEGRYDDALTAFEAAAHSQPKAAGPLIQQALCHLALGQPGPANDLLTRALELEPGNPAPHLFAGLCRSDLGDQEAAELCLQTVKKLSPDHQAVDTVRAILNLRRGNLEKAVAYLGGHPDLSLSSPIISRLVLEVERRLLPAEIPLLRRAKARILTPEEQKAPPSPGLAGLARSLGAWRTQSSGRKQVEKAMRTPPGSERRSVLLSRAVGQLRAARDADPSQFRADFYLAEALLYASRPGEGEEALRESREGFLVSWQHEGENPYLLYYLGRVTLLLGEVDASIEYFERGISKFAKFPEAHYGLGQCWLLKGDANRARDYFAKALRSDTFIMRDRLFELISRYESDRGSLDRSMPEWEPKPELEFEPAEPEPKSEPELGPAEPERPTEPESKPGLGSGESEREPAPTGPVPQPEPAAVEEASSSEAPSEKPL